MPASHLQTLRSMAYNNAWANHRLLAACGRLTQAEFEAPLTGFFPSIQATLNHILIIDQFYVDALEGGNQLLGVRQNHEALQIAKEFAAGSQGFCIAQRRRAVNVVADL